MRKLPLLVAGLALALVLGIALRPESGFTNFPPTQGRAWVAFGDSLTSGEGATEGHDYPALLGKSLAIPIINVGTPGATSHDALSKVEEVVSLDPKVVLLCFGGNDTLTGVPHRQTFQQLSQVIDRLHQSGAFIVLIGIRTASVRDKYRAEFKRLAKEKHVLYVPNILSGILGNPPLMSDYVHPNNAGYAAMADRLEKVLRPLLPELQ